MPDLTPKEDAAFNALQKAIVMQTVATLAYLYPDEKQGLGTRLAEMLSEDFINRLVIMIDRS